MNTQAVRLNQIKEALESFFVTAGFLLSQVTRENDGFTSYAVVLCDTTCVFRFYSFDFEDLEHICVWFDFAVGVVNDDQLEQAVYKVCLAINDHIHSYRVRVEPLGHGQKLITILFRSDIKLVPPAYTVEVTIAAAELATDLRRIIGVQTIRHSKAS
jgi:hypothetical protein